MITVANADGQVGSVKDSKRVPPRTKSFKEMLFGNGGGGGAVVAKGGVSDKTLRVLLEQLEAAKAQIIKQRCVLCMLRVMRAWGGFLAVIHTPKIYVHKSLMPLGVSPEFSDLKATTHVGVDITNISNSHTHQRQRQRQPQPQPQPQTLYFREALACILATSRGEDTSYMLPVNWNELKDERTGRV